ncbi:hypothetical protein BSZ05_26365 (plasmid) [Vibrio mediterranei]|uniref:Uncharacterized protein n=1 Tax=Vibrio mediterranei TaxID=689 RepID=A0AAN1FME1_9VIBR|nr:hypothetical protein BSZ05_26365 [Vibrio mediterranei]
MTAVMTGGAEANAGVSGESATSPVLFKMLNGGFLPNGHHTKLKGCTMTGSAYGDISSSRGIVRGDRLSCIRKDGSVLDIPLKPRCLTLVRTASQARRLCATAKSYKVPGWLAS